MINLRQTKNLVHVGTCRTIELVLDKSTVVVTKTAKHFLKFLHRIYWNNKDNEDIITENALEKVYNTLIY